jgi:hypothetical protein
MHSSIDSNFTGFDVAIMWQLNDVGQLTFGQMTCVPFPSPNLASFQLLKTKHCLFSVFIILFALSLMEEKIMLGRFNVGSNFFSVL